jgi:hypothetical protein
MIFIARVSSASHRNPARARMVAPIDAVEIAMLVKLILVAALIGTIVIASTPRPWSFAPKRADS